MSLGIFLKYSLSLLEDRRLVGLVLRSPVSLLHLGLSLMIVLLCPLSHPVP